MQIPSRFYDTDTPQTWLETNRFEVNILDMLQTQLSCALHRVTCWYTSIPAVQHCLEVQVTCRSVSRFKNCERKHR